MRAPVTVFPDARKLYAIFKIGMAPFFHLLPRRLKRIYAKPNDLQAIIKRHVLDRYGLGPHRFEPPRYTPARVDLKRADLVRCE